MGKSGDESRSLGYAHWPELPFDRLNTAQQSRSLGYAHWPEPFVVDLKTTDESRSLGYAHWPELGGAALLIVL